MTAYYNDFDPQVCDWLEELIHCGHIAQGVVDRRSILDVTPDDLRGFTQCHFFAGIGGWSYALRLAGWQDSWPVWTGSPPCQPFSAAGKQLGQNDERHLAPHFAELIAACRPPILFGEQVASSAVFGKSAGNAKRPRDGHAAPSEWCWLDDLSDRLERAHYAVGASDIPAASIGAPHIRQRTFFGAIRLADAERGGRDWRQGSEAGRIYDGADAGRIQGDNGSARHGEAGAFRLADTRDTRLQGRERRGPSGTQGRPGGYGSECGGIGGVADADRRKRLGIADGEGCQHHGEKAGWLESNGKPERGSAGGGMADASSGGCGHERQQCGGEYGFQPENGSLGGEGHSGSQLHHDLDLGSGPLNQFWRDADWLFCRDGKWRPVEPGTQPLAHGIPARVVRLRGYGNAIVPAAAAQFIQIFTQATGVIEQ